MNPSVLSSDDPEILQKQREICRYIELTGTLRNSVFSGVTLTSPTIQELCHIYDTVPPIVAEVLVAMGINSGVARAKRDKAAK